MPNLGALSPKCCVSVGVLRLGLGIGKRSDMLAGSSTLGIRYIKGPIDPDSKLVPTEVRLFGVGGDMKDSIVVGCVSSEVLECCLTA